MFLKRVPKNIDMYNKLLAVDPGYTVGLTQWQNVESYNYLTDEITTDQYKNPAYKLFMIYSTFDAHLAIHRPQFVIIEDINFRRGSAKSRGSLNSGVLLNITRLVGGLQAVCSLKGIPSKRVYAHQWKGNMKPKQVNKRIEYLTGEKFKSQHIADSFGLSLAHMGIFK